MLVYEEDLRQMKTAGSWVVHSRNFCMASTMSFSYKNFDLSFSFFRVHTGNDIYNANPYAYRRNVSTRNQSDRVLMRWRNPGDYTTVPRAEKDKYPAISSRFVEDGSYFKLKNVKLSYTLAASADPEGFDGQSDGLYIRG